ncbi:sulfatase-like hydrolase/transferase [Pseudomonas sp. KHPS1]|nr:sulfatase-like hydrolase/transferase [Pseudomonas sp. KHPS1]ATH80066.1 sulfatase [Pseudomonas mendocina]UTH36359.1 sulfatase-like hydrolase/transferase [Pseudomonas sp. KHPS1]
MRVLFRYGRGTRLRLVLLGILLCMTYSGNAAESDAKPNILLVMVDDLGNNDIASWGDGRAPTPTLDALSRGAVRMRHHYTDSTCSPSRASLISGRHPVSVGFQADGLGLSPDLVTLPKALRSLGYKTQHVGKWHLGEALEYEEIQPGQQGFDYWFGMLNHFVLQGPGPDGRPLRRQPTHIDPWLQDNGAAPTQHHGYLDDILTGKAVELVKAGAGGAPWFINLWLFSPHTPYQPNPAFSQQFPDTPEGRYFAILSQLDHNIARLLTALEESGQAKNTVVIFASDNGGANIDMDNNYPLVGKKATYTEGGVRTPLLLRWPGRYENLDIREPTVFMDLFPTLVAMAGGKPPVGLAGRDLRPLFEGGSVPSFSALYWAGDSGGTLGMTYSAHLLNESRFFYREPLGQLHSGAVTSAIDGRKPEEQVVPAFGGAQAGAIIRDWEWQVRPVPLRWQAAANGSPGLLTGRDFQRAPVFGGYSMGLSLRELRFAEEAQTLLDQPGVWGVRLLPDRRIEVRHGSTLQVSEPVQSGGRCDSLVISTHVKSASTFPFPGPARTRLLLYWNGRPVLDSDQVLGRPDTAKDLGNPTYVGARADGGEAFLGAPLAEPLLINKLLLPEQEGLALGDMLQRLCR